MEKHTEERLGAIVESSFDTIISKDLSGTIVSWNKAAERMFGYCEAEAVEQSIYLIVPDDKRDEEAEILRRLKVGERPETFETTRRHRNGRLVPISITISPIKSRDGQLMGASSIARDVTQTRESKRRLRLLMREINHRVKNQYAVILAVIRQTAGRSGSIEDFEKRIRERIMALSHSHDLLSQVDWAGVSLADLIAHQLKPFKDVYPVQALGPEIALDANAVLNIGMALHELIMNAMHFGLTESEGISVSWKLSSAEDGNPVEFELSWSEPALQYADLLAQDEGFGRLVLCRLVPSALSGHAAWSLADGRVVWRLTAPLSRIQVGLRDPFSEWSC
ncbi:sensor histidine kinase [Ochrobactrum soli]|uniref:Blue-light-activated histidine kinase n=1 Tax=Ochrobactrum soli TaxID=2448455 RepID=A0A2P9HEQ3_9HYPH|nr:PAS domain S-box protein [[Ochrobactrum] soli]SPL62578.1 two-component sensor histidine kinase [[Ochrobactrum] soli]